MSRTFVAVVAFTGGLAVGLIIAQVYARQKATGVVDSGLKAVGLGGGVVQQVADSLVPVVMG